jgi:hypothetical protein
VPATSNRGAQQRVPPASSSIINGVARWAFFDVIVE